MKSFCITLFISILLPTFCYSQKFKPEYMLIPDSMKVNANAIIRQYNTEIERTSLGQITRKVFIAITVLNEKGKNYGSLSISYDKLSKINKLSGKLYNKVGMFEKNIKMKDFYDYSNYQDFVFFSDDRTKSFAPISDYPYTVEYEYEIVYNKSIHIASWSPVINYDIAVENASLKFITSPELDFRIKEINFPFTYAKNKNDKGLDVYLWKVKNLKAFKQEPYSPNYTDIFPIVYIAPNKFEYDGTFGDMSTWNGYGKWAYSLTENRSELPSATVSAIKEMVKDIPDDRTKVKTLYQYLQNKTRYIAITLGIGGYQPMYAKDVDKFGYGDCKALSNYMMALLKVIDIESFYTVIGSDEVKIKYEDFPSDFQSNHIILTVPLKNDTIWLECTNQFIPFGYVGNSISNRKALLTKPSGGELINMPSFSVEDNIYRKVMNINIFEDGNSSGTLNYNASGYRFPSFGFLNVRQEKDQKDYLLKNIPLSNLQINSFKLENEGDESPIAKLLIDFKSDKYANISGNRMFIPLNQIDKSGISFNSKQKRQFPIYFSYGLINESHSTFSIPENYEIEFVPEPEYIESQFASYSALCEVKEGKIIYTRKFHIYESLIDSASYSEVCDFFDKVTKLDNAKAILKKKE